jgi:hypothetical protein
MHTHERFYVHIEYSAPDIYLSEKCFEQKFAEKVKYAIYAQCTLPKSEVLWDN